MKRGRPLRSTIRQNVVEILASMGKGYGYQIAKIYNQIFPAVSQRSVYYHLRKGLQTEEITIHTIEQEQGNFSWGKVVEKTYYALGKNATAKSDTRVLNYFQARQQP